MWKALSRLTFPYIKQQIPWKRCFITQFISVLSKKWTAKHVGNNPVCWQSLSVEPHQIRVKKTLQNFGEVEHLSKFHTCLRRCLSFENIWLMVLAVYRILAVLFFIIILFRKCSLKMEFSLPAQDKYEWRINKAQVRFIYIFEFRTSLWRCFLFI